MICPIITGADSDQDYIINMDQSPIPITFHRQRTLELVGACTVHIRKFTCDMKIGNISSNNHSIKQNSNSCLSIYRFSRRSYLYVGFRYLSMQVYLCILVIGLDGWGCHAAVGGAIVESLSFGAGFAFCSSCAFRFLQVPHDQFRCNVDPWVGCRSTTYPRWIHGPVPACRCQSC